MGVLEDVVINAKSAAETVGKEAGRLVDISMLRFNAADLQKEVSKRFETLGRIVYDSFKSGNSGNARFNEYIESIDQLYQQIDTVNEKINALRKKASCPNCGFDNDEKSAFCSRCGANLNQEQSASNTEEANDQGSEGDNSI